MNETLMEIEKKYKRLSSELCTPEVLGDREKSAKKQKELKELSPIVEKYNEYKKYENNMKEAFDIMSDPKAEPGFKSLAGEEYEAAKLAGRRAYEEIMLLLLPKDKNDDKSVIMEIRSSAGGEESALFAGVLYRMYSMYAESKHWKTEVLYENLTQLGGIKEISFSVKGVGAYARLKFESGVHRVQRIPVTEANGKIQTSTATVAVLPEAKEVDIRIDPTEIHIDTFRSSGAGGQKVNKTSSAIRITHIPTGFVVECQNERSQYRNKEKALEILRSRLLNAEIEKQAKAVAGERRLQVGTGDRSERIRTYNFPQGRITDHRIGLTLYKLDAVLNGSLDPLLDALMAADTADRLK